MKLIFVHGWSVTNTNTYRDLPESISQASGDAGLSIDIDHIYLGKYISFHNEVSMDDIARALNVALAELPGNQQGISPFSCITHSTGGPVVRYWADKYYGDQQLDGLPLKHLVMLAPANHGSSLAALGQKRVSRIKYWFGGVEPGLRVLDWLRIGSGGQMQLNSRALNFDYPAVGFYPVVISGQGVDTKAYDFLNNYLVENGSDGVIRLASANINYQFIQLIQSTEKVVNPARKAFKLEPVRINQQLVEKPAQTPFAVLHDASHSGAKMGVLNAAQKEPVHQRVVERVIAALRVETPEQYRELDEAWQGDSKKEQEVVPIGKKQKIGRYCMLVFRVKDSSGDTLSTDDYDLLLLAGKNYSADALPTGFFLDRQANNANGTVVYYVDVDKMLSIKQGLFGISVEARPDKGFSYYCKAEFRATSAELPTIFAANETTYIDITLTRFVDKNVFRFDRGSQKQGSFKNTKPSGDIV